MLCGYGGYNWSHQWVRRGTIPHLSKGLRLCRRPLAHLAQAVADVMSQLNWIASERSNVVSGTLTCGVRISSEHFEPWDFLRRLGTRVRVGLALAR